MNLSGRVAAISGEDEDITELDKLIINKGNIYISSCTRQLDKLVQSRWSRKISSQDSEKVARKSVHRMV
jgi:hypothetical protein